MKPEGRHSQWAFLASQFAFLCKYPPRPQVIQPSLELFHWVNLHLCPEWWQMAAKPNDSISIFLTPWSYKYFKKHIFSSWPYSQKIPSSLPCPSISKQMYHSDNFYVLVKWNNSFFTESALVIETFSIYCTLNNCSS